MWRRLATLFPSVRAGPALTGVTPGVPQGRFWGRAGQGQLVVSSEGSLSLCPQCQGQATASARVGAWYGRCTSGLPRAAALRVCRGFVH